MKIDGNFIVPPETHIWGNVVVAGRFARPVLNGRWFNQSREYRCRPRCQNKGPVCVEKTATICDNARLHSIQAGGNIILRPGVNVGDVNSGETIFVFGKVGSVRLFGRAVKVYGT